MNPKDRLADAPHGDLDDARPTQKLADRIVERVSTSSRPVLRFSGRLRFAGVAALVLGGIALLPLVANWRSSGAPGNLSSPAGASTSPPSVRTVKPSLLASSAEVHHFDADGIAFEYPASWHLTVSGLVMHYVKILEDLGTGSGSYSCATITPGPSDSFISGTECGPHYDIGPGQVVVVISIQEGPPHPGPIDPTNLTLLEPGDSYVTVGGLPARFHDGTLDPTSPLATLTWTLSVPRQIMSTYSVAASMKGPGIAEMRAQVEALVASVSYDPPVPVLDPADGARSAAIGLQQLTALDPSYACFPTVPGAAATATITQFPQYSRLTKPLPVTCSTAIEPNAIGLWKLALTESWVAAADRSAGSLTTVAWLAPDGSYASSGWGSAPSELPYLN